MKSTFPAPTVSKTSSPALQHTGRPQLLLGSTDRHVLHLQGRLNIHEHAATAATAATQSNSASMTAQAKELLDVDGSFGKHTESALKIFQARSGLPVTGTTDPATWNALFDEPLSFSEPSSVSLNDRFASPSATPSSTQTPFSSNSTGHSTGLDSPLHGGALQVQTDAQTGSTAGVSTFRVQSGDTLNGIGKRFGVTIEQLMSANKGVITNVDRIQKGQVIRIPVRGEIIALTADALTADALAADALTADALTADALAADALAADAHVVAPVFSAPASVTVVNDSNGVSTSGLIHSVAKGETLFVIGQQYGFTIEELMAANWNVIDDADDINIGLAVRIPGSEDDVLSIGNLPARLVGQLVTQLEEHEGSRRKLYKDSEGHPTIGIGFNLADQDMVKHMQRFGLPVDKYLNGTATMTTTQMQRVLLSKLEATVEEARKSVPTFDDLSPVRKLVVIDMIYNLGITRFRKFNDLRHAIQNQDWSRAADEMKYADGTTKRNLSTWYKQVGPRAIRLTGMMKSGQLPA